MKMEFIELQTYPTVEEQPLLAEYSNQLSTRKRHLLLQIERNRQKFSDFSLFWHNFLFNPIFYCEAAYQALLNYTEAMVLSSTLPDDLLARLEQLMDYLPAISVVDPRAEADFIDTLCAIGRYDRPHALALYNCVQHDSDINKDAMHPAVVYFIVIASVAMLITAPMLLTGVMAIAAVFSAIYLLAVMGPAGRVFEVMASEENRCCTAYQNSIAAVGAAHEKAGLFTPSAPALSHDENYVRQAKCS